MVDAERQPVETIVDVEQKHEFLVEHELVLQLLQRFGLERRRRTIRRRGSERDLGSGGRRHGSRCRGAEFEELRWRQLEQQQFVGRRRWRRLVGYTFTACCARSAACAIVA